MILSWQPVIWVDVLGSMLALLLAYLCARRSRRWAKSKPDDTFRNYVYMLTLSFVFFAVSRSFGHLGKQYLLYMGFDSYWRMISPFSGSINTATFVAIFSFGIYFHRSRLIHLELTEHRDRLNDLVKERTTELAEKNTKLEEALSKVKTLSGFLPICASCKKIRDDKGYWKQIESYIRDHSEAEFSHSICPECYNKLYSELDGKKDKGA